MEFSKIFEKTMVKPVSYGTAGYRADYTIIKDIVRRAYLFCLIQSSSVERPVGLVLTASHNPSSDNGIKYIDYTGNMISTEKEAFSDIIVNGNIEILEREYKKCENKKSIVIISRDTRPSGKDMVEWCMKASEYAGSKNVLEDMGILTTPQTHFLIGELFNRDVTNDNYAAKGQKELLQKLIEIYYSRIKSFGHVMKRVFGNEAKEKRVLDSSNGVAQEIFASIKEAVDMVVDIYILKNSTDLNEDCGSDFIKSKRELPAGICGCADSKPSNGQQRTLKISTESGELDGNTLLCAFDGDADRMLYLKPSTNQLIDGDRLCVLFSSFINHLLLVSDISIQITSVVTEYTNGAAVNELKTKGAVKVAGTGVKNMQKASNNPITIWFESNGHGTICFSKKVYHEIKNKLGYTGDMCLLDMPLSDLAAEMDTLLSRPSDKLSTREHNKGSPYNSLFRKLTKQESLLLLHCISAILNPYIGDSIVNMLVSECIFYSGFVLPDVLLGIYQDMPNILTSVKGRRERLNELVIESIKEAYSDLRVHLRASGTEDLIRIYVEGESVKRLQEAVLCIKNTLSEL